MKPILFFFALIIFFASCASQEPNCKGYYKLCHSEYASKYPKRNNN